MKKIKPNFKTLGPRYGKLMKEIAAAVGAFSQVDITRIESEGEYKLAIGSETVEMLLSDVEIITEDIPGWGSSQPGNTYGGARYYCNRGTLAGRNCTRTGKPHTKYTQRPRI